MAFRYRIDEYGEILLKLVNRISDYPVTNLGNERALVPMVTLLHSDRLNHNDDLDKAWRVAIIERLTTFGQRAVVPLVNYIMFDPRENISYARGVARSANYLTYSRIIAAKQLAKIGTTEALSGLLQAMCQDHLGIILREIGSAIATLGNKDAIQALIEILLSHHIPKNRKFAAITLGKFSQPETTVALILALQDESADVAISAAQSLGKSRPDSALSFLIEAINDFRKHSGKSGGEIRVADAVLNAIQSYNTETTNEIILKCCILHLANENVEIRWSAVYRLGEMKDDRAIPFLVEALNDLALKKSYFPERISDAAQEALQKIGSLEALTVLDDWRQNQP